MNKIFTSKICVYVSLMVLVAVESANIISVDAFYISTGIIFVASELILIRETMLKKVG